MTTPPLPHLPPEVLERLRQIGLRIDAAGRLWHQGDEVTHAGLRRALLRWLDVRADGQPIMIEALLHILQAGVQDCLMMQDC